MKFSFFVLFILPIVLNAQPIGGVQFEENQTWDQIKLKAKSERKYILIDCFATWCGPCKEMDKLVYPNPSISSYTTDNYIAVKTQIDSTTKDNGQVRQWYPTVAIFAKDYKISVFPSFVILNPDGILIHKDIGFKDTTQFLNFLKVIEVPGRQYFRLKKQFIAKTIDLNNVAYLATTAKRLNETLFANSVAKYYLQNYFLVVKSTDRMSSDNLDFIATFPNLIRSKDSLFNFLRNNKASIDKKRYVGFTDRITDNVIYIENIQRFVYNLNGPVSKQPAWNILKEKIKVNYGEEVASRIILNTQISYYLDRQDWKNLSTVFIKKIEKYGLDTSGINKIFLNNQFYTYIVLHSENKNDILKSIRFMKIIVDADPKDGINMDTYANLLYKFGERQDAIIWEEKALSLTPDEPDIKANLEKMKNGKPTWLE